MDNNKDEKNAPWLSVPQFGDWDQKGPLPDYSLDFSKIRESRKQNKRELSRTSIGNEEELVSSNKAKLATTQPLPPIDHYNQDHESPNNKRSLLSCFNCCVKA
ncbi:Pathogenic type III effector avirulence factor Avr cleavage site-containing protein [Artemisia annua]|uniref:Pathogenic type III effector avirulence factor Avr cleavage site-containing protein n=1 Tax=Artemisia annua TaxID=35608 RepID=A0A2U1PUI2_ARTAN|nr:Pathogenic type III effector avirulence factor Avr cleavage site-containing protein [Artemisia annua]PWA95524.1 Pathogenic type III effector avirulence factor Avr cleavage site-containing protein [Artemisia annua]